MAFSMAPSPTLEALERWLLKRDKRPPDAFVAKCNIPEVGDSRGFESTVGHFGRGFFLLSSYTGLVAPQKPVNQSRLESQAA
jgi:hypothetical protein